jgi:hypothetical protein
VSDRLVLVRVWHPLHLRGRELVRKLAHFAEAVVGVVKTQVDNLDFVVHTICFKASYGELELIVPFVPEGNGIVLLVALVRVDLLSVWGLSQSIDVIHPF